MFFCLRQWSTLNCRFDHIAQVAARCSHSNRHRLAIKVAIAFGLIALVSALPAVAETSEESMYIGLALEQKNKAEKALPFLKEGIEFKPTTAISHAYKAMAFNYLKQYQLAIKEAGEALKMNPDQFQASLEIAKAKEKLAAAAGSANGASAAELDSPQTEAEEAREQIKELDALIKKNPKDKDAYSERAEAFNNLLDYPRALDDYNKVIELDPSEINSYLRRAKIYAKLGQPEKALADYDQVMNIAPQSLRLLLEDKAKILLRLKETQKVIEGCNRAIKENWNEYWPYVLRAEAENDLKQYDAALADCERAYQMEPLACFDSCALQKARAHFGLLQKEKALAECNIVITIDSGASDETARNLAASAMNLSSAVLTEVTGVAP